MDGHDLTNRPEWTLSYWTKDEARTLLGADPGPADAMCYSLALYSKTKVQGVLDKRRKAEEAQAAAEAKRKAEAEERDFARARAAAEQARMRAAAKLPPVPKPKPAPPQSPVVASLVKLVPMAVAERLLGRDPLSAGLKAEYANKRTGFSPEALRRVLRGDT